MLDVINLCWGSKVEGMGDLNILTSAKQYFVHNLQLKLKCVLHVYFLQNLMCDGDRVQSYGS